MNVQNLGFNRLKGRENFGEWKIGARAYLTAEGLYNNCTTTLTESADAKTKAADAKTLAKITLLLEPSLYSHLEGLNTAKEAWDALIGIYEDKGAARRVTLLKQWISLKSTDYGSIHEYVNKSIGLRSQVKTAGFEISEQIAGSILLCGLSDEYRPLILSLEAKDSESLTLDYVKNILLQSVDFNEQCSSESALSVKKGKKKDKIKKKIKCYDCGGPHKRNEGKCPQNASKQGKSAEKSDFVLFCSPVNDHELASNQNESGEEAMYSALATANDNDDTWFADSGATKHMMRVNHNLSDKKKPVIKEVKAANGEKVKIEHVGDLKCTINDSDTCVTLKDVQYIPNLCVNLLSVSQMAKNGCVIIFDINGCRIYKEKILIASGDLKNDMFQFKIKATETAYAIKSDDSVLWHRRLAHANFDIIKSTIKLQVQRNLKCVVCAQGKHSRSAFKEIGTRATKLLERVHSDVCGPFSVNSYGGAKYYVSFVDDHSRKVFIYTMRSKSEVFDKFMEFKNRVENEKEMKIKVLRSDNGTEYDNNTFANFFRKHGIKYERSCPYTPQQNGLAERTNRTIVEKVRCMLMDANLTKRFWAEAAHAAAYIVNVLPGATGYAPNEIWYGSKPDISNIRVFGCRAMVKKPDQLRKKLDAKSHPCIYLRNADDAKGYRLYDPISRKIITSRDVIFLEDEKMIIDSNDEFSQFFIEEYEQDNNSDEINEISETPIVVQDSPDVVSGGHIDETSVIETTEDESNGSLGDESMHSADDTLNETTLDSGEADTTKDDPNFQTRAKVNENAARPITRSRQGQILGGLLNFHMAFVTQEGDDYQAYVASEPQSYNQALTDENSIQWKEAMEDEFGSLIRNNTWQLVEKPPGVKIVDNKWVYKVKRENDTLRFKARLVARGFTQEYGINYYETFSPVVRFTSIRSILAISAQKGLLLKQFDVKTAFLHGDLKELVYMRQPIGFEDGTNRICKLNKSLYGLKQASRCWNEKFTFFIRHFGFEQSVADPCVFICKRDGKLTVMAIHVDDGLIAGECSRQIADILKWLNKHFEVKEMDVGCFLGLEIEQKSDGSIFVHQKTYANRVLERFGMQNCNGVASPSDVNQTLYHFDESEKSKYPYRELIGSLMYLAVGTRPDISHAVGMVSRFMENPTVAHEAAAKRIVKYIRKTINFGILYNCSKSARLKAYSDADYAGDIDTRRSTSGYVFLFGDSVVSWGSERQKSVSLSTTESEYMAAALCTQELIWIKKLFGEILGEDAFDATLYMDNQSAIRLIKNPEFHKRSKHIDIKYHFIREKYEDNFFKLEYVSTKEMLADVFTKAIPPQNFGNLVKKLSVMEI